MEQKILDGKINLLGEKNKLNFFGLHGFFAESKIIPPLPPPWYKTGNAGSRRFPSFRGNQRPQQGAFAAFEVDRVVRDLDALCESPDMIPPIAAPSKPEPGTGFARQFPHGRAYEALMGRTLQDGIGPFGVGPRLIR